MGRVHKDQRPLCHGDLAPSTLPATQNLTEDKRARLKPIWGRQDRSGGGRQTARVGAGAGAAPHFTDRHWSPEWLAGRSPAVGGLEAYYDAYLLDSGQVSHSSKIHTRLHTYCRVCQWVVNVRLRHHLSFAQWCHRHPGAGWTIVVTRGLTLARSRAAKELQWSCLTPSLWTQPGPAHLQGGRELLGLLRSDPKEPSIPTWASLQQCRGCSARDSLQEAQVRPDCSRDKSPLLFQAMQFWGGFVHSDTGLGAP